MISHFERLFHLAFACFLFWCGYHILGYDLKGDLLSHHLPAWGDWAAHFTFISQYLNLQPAVSTPSENPLFLGIPNQYPFLSHLLTALFSKLGSAIGVFQPQDPVMPTWVLSTLLLTILPVSLYQGFRLLGLKKHESHLGTFCFLFFGGLQFIILRNSGSWTNQIPQGSAFTNFLMYEFIPQRAFLFGLVGALLTSRILVRGKSFLSFAWSMTFFSILPLLHIHSWIASSVFLLVYALITRKKSVWIFGSAVALLSVIAIRFILFVKDFPSEFRTHWSIFQPGFQPDLGLSIRYWLINTGIFLPWVVWACYRNRNRITESPAIFAATLSGLILFILAFFIQLQPYFYDNLKIFTYAVLFMMPIAMIELSHWINLKNVMNKNTIVALAFILSITVSGLHDTVQYLGVIDDSTSSLMFKQDDFERSKRLRAWAVQNNTSIRALAHPTHLHWALCLAGAKTALGYQGWLYSWGIEYSAREALVAKAWSGDESALKKLVKDLKLNVAILSRGTAIADMQPNISFYQRRFPVIFDDGQWLVVSLVSPPGQLLKQ